MWCAAISLCKWCEWRGGIDDCVGIDSPGSGLGDGRLDVGVLVDGLPESNLSIDGSVMEPTMLY